MVEDNYSYTGCCGKQCEEVLWYGDTDCCAKFPNKDQSSGSEGSEWRCNLSESKLDICAIECADDTISMDWIVLYTMTGFMVILICLLFVCRVFTSKQPSLGVSSKIPTSNQKDSNKKKQPLIMHEVEEKEDIF